MNFSVDMNFYLFFQTDYIRRMSMKMSSVHTLPLNTAANVSSSNADTISTDRGSEMKSS